MTGSSAPEARSAATAAAARARVVIRPAHTLAEVQTARRVIDAVWQPSADDPAVTESLLWPIVHAGNYCAIAYDAGRRRQRPATRSASAWPSSGSSRRTGCTRTSPA